MSKIKKIICLLLALTLSFALAVPALAYNIGEVIKEVPGYGSLQGSLYDDGICITRVDQNPDNAILTLITSLQDSSGNTIETRSAYGNRGDVLLMECWDSFPANAHALYGTHGVQGGSTYQAAVVYTVTHNMTKPTE